MMPFSLVSTTSIVPLTLSVRSGFGDGEAAATAAASTHTLDFNQPSPFDTAQLSRKGPRPQNRTA
jgi:hypothetical protein